MTTDPLPNDSKSSRLKRSRQLEQTVALAVATFWDVSEDMTNNCAGLGIESHATHAQSAIKVSLML